jgi:hypothetical protein
VFLDEVGTQDGQPGDIAPGPGEAGDEATPQRIADAHHDDRDVVVACLAASAAGVFPIIRTSTSSRTNSAARAGNRSYCPSAARTSRTKCWPST